MKSVKLQMDHRQFVAGKEVLHRAGETIEVSDKVYIQIVEAVRQSRISLRNQAAKVPGSPEWNAAQNDC